MNRMRPLSSGPPLLGFRPQLCYNRQLHDLALQMLLSTSTQLPSGLLQSMLGHCKDEVHITYYDHHHQRGMLPRGCG